VSGRGRGTIANEGPSLHVRCIKGCIVVINVCTVVDGEAALWMMAGSSFSNILVLRKKSVVINHVITPIPNHCKRADT
jgi:hypothetical protein